MSIEEFRRVSSRLTVRVYGHEYDVSKVPGVWVGQKLLITCRDRRHLAAQVSVTMSFPLPEIHVKAVNGNVHKITAGINLPEVAS